MSLYSTVPAAMDAGAGCPAILPRRHLHVLLARRYPSIGWCGSAADCTHAWRNLQHEQAQRSLEDLRARGLVTSGQYGQNGHNPLNT
jgi:hypothetical protein